MDRRGGLSGRLDPEVEKFRDKAARNLATRTKKEEYDANRVRLKLDIPAWLKAALKAEAKRQDTSMNQLASYLLAGGLFLLNTTEHIQLALDKAKRPSQALRINFDVEISDDIRAAIVDGSEPT